MNVFRRMLEWYDGGRRWIAGSRGGNGYGCLLGGCSVVLYNSAYHDGVESLQANRKLAEVIKEQFPEIPSYLGAQDTIMHFNDRVAEGYGDIERILEKAAVKEDEGW